MDVGSELRLATLFRQFIPTFTKGFYTSQGDTELSET